MELTDWRGTPIEVGSTIVYAVTQSSSLTMVEAKVEEIGLDRSFYGGGRDSYFLWVERRNEHGYVGWRDKEVPINQPCTAKVAPKRVKLTAIERVTVVPPRKED